MFGFVCRNCTDAPQQQQTAADQHKTTAADQHRNPPDTKKTNRSTPEQNETAQTPPRIDRYRIFAREQQQMARLQAQGAFSKGALDLAGYVEFNRNYR
jgi:hypothetical protein